jgi:DNA repair exonuclease SbcCD ATPase subunit
MELSIKNFKSIQSMNFTFGRQMTLLKGPSGAGKSTILESIVWALSGFPKRCKPLGSSLSTHVSIKIDDFIVSRKSRPNSLKVIHKKKELFDDEAQSFLNLFYGEKFQVVGFVQQNTQKSFICMTPAKKLEFLEKFTLDGEVTEIKEKVTILIKKCKIDFTKAEAKHEVLLSQFKKTRQPKPLPKPLPNFLPHDNIIMYQTEKKSLSDLRDKLIRKSDKTQRLLQNANRADSARLLFTREIDEVDVEIHQLNLPTNSKEKLSKFYAETQKNIKICEEINYLKSTVPEDFERFLQNYEDVKTKQKQNIKNIKKQIKNAEIGNISHIGCPHCKNMICVNHTTFRAEKSKKTIVTHSCEPSFISNLIEKKSRIFSQLSEKKKDVLRYTKTLLRTAKLEKETKNTELLQLRQRLSKLQSLLKSYERHQLLLTRQKTLKEKLDNVSSCGIEDLQEKYDETQKSLSDIRRKIKECDNSLEKCREKELHKKEVVRYELKSSELIHAAEVLEKKTTAVMDAQVLRELIHQAESLALLNTIENINNRASIFIDSFFVENPISVTLSPFSEVKSTKKVKASIKLNILNKGESMNLDDLSGGEKARVVLAFNLALCEITNTSLILLDEVTASLNQVLSEQVFEKISETLKDYIVISVAHQCVDGTFEEVIVLD